MNIDNARFNMKRIFQIFEVPDLSMSGSLLSEELSECAGDKNVLEFGSGGSTFLLSKHAKQVYSIETDRYFARYMRRCLKNKNISNATILYANVGRTTRYGFPVKSRFRTVSGSKVTGSVFQWNEFPLNGIDLVFIDGRYRVFCAFQCFIHLKGSFVLIFDDYKMRTEYHEIEKIIGQPSKFVGDAAFFEISRHRSLEATHFSPMDKYEIDPR